MRLGWTRIAVVAAALLASSQALAQRAVFNWENDAIGDTDRDYSDGFRLSFVFDDFSRDILAGKAFDFVSPGLITFGAPGGPVKQQFEWIALAQSIYTPDHTTVRTPRIPGVDRPFGGWLYTGFNVAQETGRRQLDSFEFQVGAVGGSASLANAVQSSFHRLLSQTAPFINGYELHNEPGFLLAWDRRWKFGTEFGGGYGVDFIPSIGFTGGNVFTYGEVGAIARIGRSLSTTWGPTVMRPGITGANFISPNPDAPFWGFDLFAGAQARGVARNIFLDGNTFQDSLSVTREVFVYDLIAGAELFSQSGFGATATVIRRSREYTTQPKSSSLYGSLALSARF
ncbi:MAG: lipid A deacylase LpxR family protein [Rhodopseudomonas sp.]|uniref:lipid A deacylase LpxR family protein n=1 Tax=Rhodopseudomonas sp. TaxID=1078 RepID=UPI0018330FF1|nr:lipid A deacylase LpxR family protein [Rhodopseudomonas sp.]NVN88458.1 lipid A deacylase LpxR family protein [Rhodopseudomonas sp.]